MASKVKEAWLKMKYKNGGKCNNCRKQIKRNEDVLLRVLTNEDGDANNLWFCSKDCLQEWEIKDLDARKGPVEVKIN